MYVAFETPAEIALQREVCRDQSEDPGAMNGLEIIVEGVFVGCCGGLESGSMILDRFDISWSLAAVSR